MESVSKDHAGLLRFCVLSLAVIALWSYAETSHAAVYYFIGSTQGANSDRWERAANWSTLPRGSGGGAVPTSGDTVVLSYSGTTVRIRSNAVAAGILLANTWTGALQMGTGTLTAGAGGIRVGSGTFVAGAGNIQTTGGYTQTGGVVSGVQATLNLSGSLSITSVSNTSPSFTSTGTIVFSGGATQTYTVGAPTRVRAVLKNVIVSNSAAAGSNHIYSSGSGMSLSGSLTISQGVLDLTKSSTAQALTVNGGMTVANLTTAGFTSANNVTLSGALTINGQSTWTATGGTFTLKGNAPQPLTLNGGGRRFNIVVINNTGVGQQANVIVSGSGMFASGSLTVTAGRLDLMTNSQALAVKGGITLANAAAAVLKTRSNITMSGGLTIGYLSTFTATGGTFTLNGDAPQPLVLNGGGKRFNNLTINNTGTSTQSNVIVSGSGMFASGSLTVTAGRLDLMTNSQALAVKGGITLANAAAAVLKTRSNITMSGGLTIGYLSTFTATGGTFTLNGDAPQPLVLNGGGKRFNNLTINNTGTSTQSNVIVSGSGMYASGALTVTAGRLDLMTNSQALAVKGGIAVNGSSTLKTRSNITMSGALTIGASATFTATGGTLTFNGDNPQTVTIASSNQRFNNVTINNSGGSNTQNKVTFVTNSFTVLGNVLVTAGSWDATTNSIPAFVVGNITVSDAALARFITAGNLTTSGSITVKPAGTFSQTAGTTNLNGTSQTLSGSMTFYNLQKNIASADTLAFYPGYTYTVSNSVASLNGASSTAKLTMNSPLTGQRWTFTPPAKNTLQYLSLKDSYNTRLTGQVCLDCTNGGNNLNWAFEDTPTVTGGAGTSSTSGGGGSSGGGRGGGGGSAVSTSPSVTTPAASVTTPVKVKAAQLKGLQKRADMLQKNIDKIKNVKAKKALQKALDRLKKTIKSRMK